jgi:hypothetical protein
MQIILLIILTNLLFYYRTLSYAGICDDIPVFNKPEPIGKGWMKFWYHLHGRKYQSYKLAHCQTLGIHTLNCVLIYLAFGSNYISALTALLFAVNPVNNQCSVWMSGKGYSMNTTCALLMWMFPYVSPLTYVYGLYFNGASLLFFPLVFLFTKYWWLSSLVLLGLWREHMRIFDKKNPGSKFNTESNNELRAIAPRKIIVMFKSLGYYFINALSAMRLGFYHKYLFLHGVNKDTNKDSYKIDKYFFIGITIALTTLITHNLGLVWFCANIIMWCNFISFNQTITNRYIYLPNVGLMLIISSLLMVYPPLALVALTYYITKLCLFLYFYKAEYWSIENSCIEQPDFFYPFQNRSVHCFQNGNYQGELFNMIKANELRPNDWKISYNICQLYMLLGNLKASREWFAKAKECNIDGREVAIGNLMTRLETWMNEVEEQAKANGNAINLDIGKFDMQR